MIPTSKIITNTLALSSVLSAILLVTIYGTLLPLRLPTDTKAEPVQLAINPLLLTAHSAVVYDPTTKQFLYEKNANDRLPLASLAKLMSAEALLSSPLLNSSVVITKESLKPSGDSGFRVGESWGLNDLIRFGLVASSNDAMAAAALALNGNIVDRMNLRARELGLTETYFYNPTGLDLDLETAGAYGSAHDMAVLVSEFLLQYPGEFQATASPTVSISSSSHHLEATSTATPLLEIPGLVGAKTGYTDLAGGNLVAVIDVEVGRPIVVVVLGSSLSGRFTDVKLLVNETRKYVMSQP